MSEAFAFSTSKPPDTMSSKESAVAFASARAMEHGRCGLVWMLSKAAYSEVWAYTTISDEDAERVDKSDLVESYRILRYVPELMAPKEFHVYVMRAVEVRLVQAKPEAKK
jgi:hypothetical protein